MRLTARLVSLLVVLSLAPLRAETAPLPPALAALRAKAEAGEKIAQYNLGRAYAEGREMPADLAEAYVWLSLAAENGSTGKAYDNLLQEISPAQLADAKRRLALHKPAVASAAAASPITLAPLDAPADRSAELTAKNQQLTTALAAAQAKLEAADAAAGRAVVNAKADSNAVADALTGKLTAEKAATAQAQAAAQSAEAARAALEGQLTATKNELASAQGKLTTATTQAARLTALETENARVLKQTATLQTQLDEATADRVILKQKLADAGRTPTPKKDDSAPQIAALQAQVATLTAAKSAAEQKLSAAEAHVAAPSASAAPANREELIAANAKLETVLRSFTLAQNENAGLKAAVEAAKTESSSLRQQLADAQSKSAAPATASTEDPAALKRELKDSETKLSVALRSYVVIAAENDKLKAEASTRANSSTQAVAAVETRAATAAVTQSAQLAELRDQLRQVQAQSAAYAEDNFQLRTRLAAASGGTAPSRAADRVTPSAVPTTTPIAPAATPAAEPVQRTHTIVAGDTLQGLAKKYYGDAARWNEILTANNDVLGGKSTLVIGRKLRIP